MNIQEPAGKKSFYPGYNEPREFNAYMRVKSKKVVIEIDGEIESSSQFRLAIAAMSETDEGDTVIINLQSPGGSMDATDSILHAMKQCDAHIHVIATGNCSSAATFILLECDSFELSDNFNALIHCGSVGAAGNTNEFRKSSVFYNNYMEKTMRDAYKGMLSEEELVAMLNGQDIWLDAQAWCDRYEARYRYFVEKAEETQANVARLKADLATKEAEETKPACCVENKTAKSRKPATKRAKAK